MGYESESLYRFKSCPDYHFIDVNSYSDNMHKLPFFGTYCKESPNQEVKARQIRKFMHDHYENALEKANRVKQAYVQNIVQDNVQQPMKKTAKKQKEEDFDKVEISPVTRLEVINHAKNSMPIGRLLTLYKSMGDFDEIELSYQDGGKTLKIFLC